HTHTRFALDTAAYASYTLSLHDALPIWTHGRRLRRRVRIGARVSWRVVVATRILPIAFGFVAAARELGHEPVALLTVRDLHGDLDRKSTRLNSSHDQISYAVFCLKKKKT